MNPFALSGLLAGITSLSLALFVYFNNRESVPNRIWSLFAIAVAVWGFGVYKIATTTDMSMAFTWWRLAHIGVIGIPVLFFHFVCRFLDLQRKTAIAVMYGAGLIFLALDGTDLFIANMRFVFSSFYYDSPPGPAYPPFVVFFLGVIAYSHYELIKAYQFSSGIRKNQIKYFFLATVVGFAGGTTCFLPVFGIDVYPFLNFTVPLYPIIMAYAIARYRLMDITLVFQKGLAYGLLLGALIPAYILILGLEWLFTGTRQYVLAGILLVTFTIFAGVLVNLQARLETAVGKALFPKRYYAYNALNEFSTAMRSNLDLKALTEETVTILSLTLNIGKISIFLLDEERDEYLLTAAHGIDASRIEHIRLIPKDLLPQYLQETGQVILKEELEHSGKSLGIFGKGITDTLNELESELCLPLQNHGRLIGFLNLGHKLNRSMYTQEELKTLAILAASAASAFANADLHQTAKEEQRREKREERALAFETIAGGFAHEIRNPLVSIKTFLQLVPLQKDDPEFMEAFRNVVINDTARIERLSGEVLGFARLHEPQRKHENLNEVVAASLRSMKQRAQSQHVELITELATDLPHVWIDKQQTHQVVANLHINALDAMGANGGGQLTTKTRRLVKPNGVWVQLEVTDTGCGMEAETLEQVFVPFFTTKHESKEREGTGLGLPICQRIVEAHDGYIEVKSEIGKGTSFFVNLPVRQLQKESAEKVEGIEVA